MVLAGAAALLEPRESLVLAWSRPFLIFCLSSQEHLFVIILLSTCSVAPSVRKQSNLEPAVIEINKINMYCPRHGNLNTGSSAACSKGRDVVFEALAAYAPWHSGSCIT